jgi:hypothetical protein
MLCSKRGLAIDDNNFSALESSLPILLTPGAAETLAVKVYRTSRTGGLPPAEALRASLADYQNPVPLETMEFQIRLATREASDLEFVPSLFRERTAGQLKSPGSG